MLNDMDAEFDRAKAVVFEAFTQKYGKSPTINVDGRKTAMIAGLDSSLTSKQRSLEMIRQLVQIYESGDSTGTGTVAASASATANAPELGEAEVAPAGATLITALDGTSPTQAAYQPPAQHNVKLPPQSRVQMSSTFLQTAPFASPQFVELLPVSGAALKAKFPLGMSRVGGVFVPCGTAQARWPCLMLDVEPEGETRTTVPIVLASESQIGAYYKCEKPLEIGPSAVSAQTRKVWLRDCRNEEISFGADASIGQRVTVHGKQSQTRFHNLSISENAVITDSTDVSALRILDDNGDSVGPISRVTTTDISGSFRAITDGETPKDKIYVVEMPMSGAGPVSVYVSVQAPCLCIV